MHSFLKLVFALTTNTLVSKHKGKTIPKNRLTVFEHKWKSSNKEDWNVILFSTLALHIIIFLGVFLNCITLRLLRRPRLLLTYSVVQSPSWEANWFAASQEIPRISQNPKVHYRTHKRPPSVSILGQPNPVHIPTSHILEILSCYYLHYLCKTQRSDSD